MTEKTEDAGALEAQAVPGLLATITGGKPFTAADLARLTDALATPGENLPQVPGFPPLARKVTLTEDAGRALRELPGVFGRITPATRRRLTPAELKDLAAELDRINAVTTSLGERATAISRMVAHSMDVQAEEAGTARPEPETVDGKELPATPRVQKGVWEGHYLLGTPGVPFEIPVEGCKLGFRQVPVSGRAYMSMGDLDRMLDEELISRATYLAITRTAREIDPDKLARFIDRHPAEGVHVVAGITHREAPTASLHKPKKN